MWTKLIESFSSYLKDIRNRIRMGGEGGQFYIHACKIMANPNNASVNHWVEEMFNLCEWMQDIKIKPNNKPIPRSLINEFLDYGEDLEMISNSLNRAYSNYHNSEKRKDKSNDELLLNNYRQFCNEVGNNLENKTLDIGTLSSLVNQYLILK